MYVEESKKKEIFPNLFKYAINTNEYISNMFLDTLDSEKPYETRIFSKFVQMLKNLYIRLF